MIATIIGSGCCSSKKIASGENNSSVVNIPGPRVIIYKTRSDYSQNVPILLSPDKKSVVSYPDIKDIKRDGNLTLPTPLKKGFLLDNRGINADVAFISLTYEQYAALPKTPNSQELLKLVIDKKPLKKMYSCGLKSKYENLETELNIKIESGDFDSFVRIK